MAAAKNKWPWAKSITKLDDLTLNYMLEAYNLNNKPCSKGKHRPCKNNLRCVDAIIEKHWGADDSPSSGGASKLKGKIPYSGLKNAGALCYCNVFLQLWFHNPRFRDEIYKWHPVRDGGMDAEEFDPETYIPNCDSPFGQLQLIFALMEFGNAKVVDPIKLAESLKLNQNTHQDPQEFATLFLNLKEFISKNVTKKLYMIEYNNIITCKQCGGKNTVNNSMMNFQLPLTAKQQSVTEIIKDTMKGEKLEGDNQYNCGKCSMKVDAVKKMEFTSLPPTCVFQVLRSKYDREKNRIVKLKTFLEIPQELDLTPFTSNEAKDGNTKYELKAVVVHLGAECSGGHYIVNIKSQRSKWYSFNDTEVSNMKSDCLVEGGKTSKVVKELPDSLLSNCAYMLVYDAVDQKEVVPTMPGWLEPLVNQSNRELTQEDNILKSEELQRTRQWEDNYEHMTHMKNRIDAESGIDTKGDILPLKWFSSWAEVPQIEEDIDNKALLCPHKKLAFNKVFMTRIVSTDVADELFCTYGGGPRLSVPECLCQDCIFAQCKLLQKKEDIEKHAKIIMQDQKQKKKTDTPPTDGFWVSKVSFGKWRALALARIEAELIKTEDQVADVDEDQAESKEDEKSEVKEEDQVDKDSEEKTATSEITQNGESDEAVPCKIRKVHGEEENVLTNGIGENEDHGEKNGHTDMAEFVFNSDLICEHDGFSTNVSLRKQVPEKVWNILADYFPNAHRFPISHETCILCRDMDDATNQDMGTRIELARMIKDDLPALIAFPSTTNMSNKHVGYETRALRPKILYAVSFDFVEALSKFVKNPTKVPKPGKLKNESLICEHAMVHVDLGLNGRYDVLETDKRFWVLVDPTEWNYLAHNFEHDHDIRVITNHEADDSDAVEPEICTDCLLERKKLTEYNYQGVNIYIRKVGGDGASEDSGRGQSRTRRNRRQKGDIEIRVDATDTIRMVKTQIMKVLNNGCTFSDLHLSTDVIGGRKLTDLNATLADYEVPYNAVLLLKEDKVNDADSDDGSTSAMQVDPEQGFLGTNLAQQ